MTTCTPEKTNVASQTANVVKPRYTVNATKDSYQVQVDLPGAPKDGVSVKLDEGILTVTAQRKSASQESWKSLYQEFGTSSYSLRLKVAAQVDEAALTAKLEDGVLTLNLPVRETAKARVVTVE